MKNKLFSIIIPLHNEEGNIISLLKEFSKFNNKTKFELILINDGSLDGTEKLLKNIYNKYSSFLKVISYKKNKGYGGAILTGLKIAKGNVLGWMHSDLQTDVKYIFSAYELFIKSGNDKILIKGNRKKRQISQVIFSNTMSLFCSIIFGFKLFEINAQPKVFSRVLYNKFDNAPIDFSLDLYLLILAKRNKFLFKSINVNFIDRVYGESKWANSFNSKIKTILRTIKYIFKLKLGKR